MKDPADGISVKYPLKGISHFFDRLRRLFCRCQGSTLVFDPVEDFAEDGVVWGYWECPNCGNSSDLLTSDECPRWLSK